MPPPTSSLKPNAAAAKKENGASNGTSKEAAGEDKKFVGKPDQAKYNAEQDALNKEIAAVKSKLVSAATTRALVVERKGTSSGHQQARDRALLGLGGRSTTCGVDVARHSGKARGPKAVWARAIP
jgi:hypothetical protein